MLIKLSYLYQQVYVNILQMQKEQEQSDIILDEESIQRIEGIDLTVLNDYSQRFRISSEEQERLSSHSEQGKQFQEGVVQLIALIQPSKLSIAAVLDVARSTLHRHFPQDSKFVLRDEAKSKSILVINKLTTEQEFQLVTQIQAEMQKFQRCILLHQAQLSSLLFLQDNRSLPLQDLALAYEQSYKHILDFIISPQKCSCSINFSVISKIFKYQLKLFEDFSVKSLALEGTLQAFEKDCDLGKHINASQQLVISKSLRDLKILTSKLSTLVELFPFACLKPKDDLLSFEVTDQRWKRLFESGAIYYKLYGQPQKIDASFNQLRTNLNIVNATMNILNQAKANPGGLKYLNAQIESIGKVLKCTLSSKTAYHEAELMIADPSEVLAKQIWNLPQKKQFKAFIELTLPSIAFSEHLYIPRIARSYFFRKAKHEEVQLPNYNIADLRGYYQQLYVGGTHQQKLPIRINCAFQLDLRAFQQEQPKNFFQKHIGIMNKNIQSIKNAFKKKVDPPKAVIFHIHGGGFISMSSFIHQTYTRRWANALNVPIVSVDYGKAPEYPFPEGLYDCLEAYLWTLYSFSQVYQAEPQRIILVGDSAGGNLVGALTNLLIEWGLRVPDGVVFVYPALNLNYFDFTPSLLTALNDMILPHTFLKICLKSYLRDPGYQPGINYFISPIRAPPTIFAKYPTTRIFVGSKDPFHDDCCRLAQQLSNNCAKGVRLVIFEEFPHGFLQFDMKNSPHYYCQQATKEVEKALSELLSL